MHWQNYKNVTYSASWLVLQPVALVKSTLYFNYMARKPSNPMVTKCGKTVPFFDIINCTRYYHYHPSSFWGEITKTGCSHWLEKRCPLQQPGASSPPLWMGDQPPHLTRWSTIHLVWAEHGGMILLFGLAWFGYSIMQLSESPKYWAMCCLHKHTVG